MSDDDIFKDVKKVAQVNINSEVTQNIHLPSEKPPLPFNIPTPKGFIGRVDELTQLQTAKDSGKSSFVLHGAGGVGKTDLALEFIRRSKADYQAGIRIDMQGLSDKPLQPKDAKLEVIRAFEPTVPADLSNAEINNLYESLLNRHRTILFFDNVKDRAQVESLNDASALIVITSRETFNVSGGFGKEVEQMSPADARQLLYSMADETRFDGQADNLADLAGYLPMAILPLAALLVSDITLEAKDLVQRYADRQERLRLADPNRENLSVEASFDLSYDTLNDELQTFWRKLTVFPADFDLEAMQAVWDVENGTMIRAELVTKHLLEFDTNTKRSKLHDLARDYANEKLKDDECFQTQFLFAKHYASILLTANKIQATKEKTGYFEALKLIDVDLENIIAGQKWTDNFTEKDNKIAELCISYSGTIPDLLALRLPFKKIIEWNENSLKASRNLENIKYESTSLGNLGSAYLASSQYKKAINFFQQQLDISQKIGNKYGAGSSLSNLGLSYANLGNIKKAVKCYEQSIYIKREINDIDGLSSTLTNLGIYYQQLGKKPEAIKHLLESLLISQKIGNKQSEANNLLNLGSVYFSIDKIEESFKFYEQALRINKEIGNKAGESNCLENLALIFSYLGNFQKAIEFHKQALQISIETKDVFGEQGSLSNLGLTYIRSGKHKTAIDYNKQSLEIARNIGNKFAEASNLGNLGLAYAGLGEKEKARDYYLQSIAIFEGIESPNAEIARRNLELLESNS